MVVLLCQSYRITLSLLPRGGSGIQLVCTEEPSAKRKRGGRTLKADQHGRAWKGNDLLPPPEVGLIIVYFFTKWKFVDFFLFYFKYIDVIILFGKELCLFQ